MTWMGVRAMVGGEGLGCGWVRGDCSLLVAVVADVVDVAVLLIPRYGPFMVWKVL